MDIPDFPKSSKINFIRLKCYRYHEVKKGACIITAQVSNTLDGIVELVLKNIPWNEDDVESWASDMDGQWEEIHTGRILEVTFDTTRVTAIRDLAKAIRRVTWGGVEYLDSNWKWIARRTANSLDKFADRVMEFRRLRKNNPHLLPSPSSVEHALVSAGSNSKSETTNISKQDDDDDIFYRLQMGGAVAGEIATISPAPD